MEVSYNILCCNFSLLILYNIKLIDFRSTRFFGPMVFYLAWNNIIDKLLLNLLETGVIRESVSLISLQRIIHPELTKSDETPELVNKASQRN